MNASSCSRTAPRLRPVLRPRPTLVWWSRTRVAAVCVHDSSRLQRRRLGECRGGRHPPRLLPPAVLCRLLHRPHRVPRIHRQHPQAHRPDASARSPTRRPPPLPAVALKARSSARSSPSTSPRWRRRGGAPHQPFPFDCVRRCRAQPLPSSRDVRCVRLYGAQPDFARAAARPRVDQPRRGGVGPAGANCIAPSILLLTSWNPNCPRARMLEANWRGGPVR